MYLNKIDDLFNSAIDDFYTIVILKNKNFQKILGEENFIKYQEVINEVIQSYMSGITEEMIGDVSKKKNSIDEIFDTIKRYCMIYAFLVIGTKYKGKPDMYINNVIEFSKNQAQYPVRINNFFNSESNAELIKMYYIVTNIIKILEKNDTDIRYDTIKKEPYSTETVEFMKELGTEFINAYFRKTSSDSKQNKTDDDRIHDIIKTMIILLIYRVSDKKKLYNTIEESENNDGEYIFIDIMEPVTEQINFMTVESLLSKEDAMSGMAHEIWGFMQSVKDEELEGPLTVDKKIDILINSGIIVPILDDFLLYHRDTERYDRISTEDVKKKEDTKIRYIIGKIDTTTELYSDLAKKDDKLKTAIMKNFSTPLYNRKAILRNDIEEIGIINKFINQGKRAQEKNDYLNDLFYHRRYTYINFKDFEKYGFSHTFTKTVQAVRAVNFDTSSDFKQINDNHKLQRRVATKGSTCNIVGFMIPPTNKPVLCLKISDIMNIKGGDADKKGGKNKSKNNKNKNGFDLFTRQLSNISIKQKENKKALYWLFDLQTDSQKKGSIDIGNATSINGNSDQEIIKSMIGELYDKIMSDVYFEIISKIDLIPDITPQIADKIVRYMEKNVLGVPIEKDLKNLIKSHTYKKFPKDPKNTFVEEIDDVLYGIEGDVLKLPEYITPKPKYDKINIDLAAVETTGEEIDIEVIEGLCQHNITWDNITQIKRTDYTQHMKQMYEFIQQYIVEDTSGDFVCKSCGYYVDITRYIADGKFDDSSQKFITFSMPMEINIVDLPEYRKLDFAIKIIDKNIDKLCSSVGIPFFVGNTTTVKWRRQSIVKSTIDMVRSNNRILSKTFKIHNDKKEETYGISKNLSSLFVFEMENNIYMTSSKDKDQEQFKMIKRNNLIVYIMIYLIMELNESQLTFFAPDKGLCDIRIFDKVWDSLFKGLRIKKNNSADTVPLTNYKLLCYMIYMISCRIAKHKLWYSSQSVQTNINKMIPIIQRFVVHTFVDILNSILENSFKPDVEYIFEIFRVKFYSKLGTIFSDNAFYDILLGQSKETYALAKKRESIDPSKIKQVQPFKFMKPVWPTVLKQRYFLRHRDVKPIDLHDVSNMTNCPSGDFHKWAMKKEKGSGYICSLCNTVLATVKYDETSSKQIIENFKDKRLNEIALKLCLVDLQPHIYLYDSKQGKNICAKCHNPDTQIYKNTELKKIKDIITKQKIEYNSYRKEKNDMYNDFNKKTETYIDSVVKKNSENLAKARTSENPFKYIKDFISEIQKLIGEEIKGAFPIHLTDNTYIIDHDHYGNKINGDPIIIRESDKKVNIKIDHPHYKTDVMYYTDMSGSRIDVFYDTVSRKLLGYKEASKDYVDYGKSDKKIRVNYSLINKLYIIGYSAQYINIYDSYPELSDAYEGKKIEDRQELYKNIITVLCGERLENLKKIIVDFQRILNRILNGYEPERMELIQNDFIFFNNTSNTNPNPTSNQNNVPSSNNPNLDQSAFRKKRQNTSNFPYTVEPESAYSRDNPNYFSEKLDNIIGRHKNNLLKINISDGNKKHKIFKHWKAITRGITAKDKTDIYLNSGSDVIDTFIINRYDDESHQILFYILDEFTKLIKFNSANFTKISIANFIVEFIDRIFFSFNNEHLITNTDIRRFMYIVSSPRYIREIAEEGDADVKREGFYDEVVSEDLIEPTDEEREQQIDDDEEADALDLDMDVEDIEEGFASAFEGYNDIDADRGLSREFFNVMGVESFN